jgi:hypothetical protein
LIISLQPPRGEDRVGVPSGFVKEKGEGREGAGDEVIQGTEGARQKGRKDAGGRDGEAGGREGRREAGGMDVEVTSTIVTVVVWPMDYRIASAKWGVSFCVVSAGMVDRINPCCSHWMCPAHGPTDPSSRGIDGLLGFCHQPHCNSATMRTDKLFRRLWL